MTQIVIPQAAGVPPAAVPPASAPPAATPSTQSVPVQPVQPQSGDGTAVQPEPAPSAAAPAPLQAGTALTPEAQAPAEQPAKPQGIAAVPTDKLVEAYVQLRDDKDAITARHKEELRDHNNMMEKIGGELDARLQREGAKTFSTDHGSATRVVTTNAVCNDWAAFEKWVLETQRFDVFPKKLNYGPFKEMAANDEPMPPGVRLESSSRIQVRRKN